MKQHGGDVLVDLLLDYGVSSVFGLAGGQTLPLYDAIRSRRPRIRHFPMRDERSAAYAADGYARLSGRVGVCDATVGPGAVKLTSGLAEAFNSSIPLLAVVSDMPSDWLAVRYRGGGNQLVDQMAVLAPLCKWTGRLPNSDKLPELVQRAFQLATTGRPGPVVIELPEDLFRAVVHTPVPRADASRVRFGAAPAFRPAPEAEVARAAVAMLQSAERPVMIAGGGAWLSGAGVEVRALAERLALPVATSLSGKGILPESHPLSLGVLGSLGSALLAESFVAEADLIFAVGFKFAQNPTHRWTLPTTGQRLIQLDIDAGELGKVFPVDIGMVADVRTGLRVMLDHPAGSRPLEPVAARVAASRREAQARLTAQAGAARPIKPQQVAAELDRLAGPDTVLVCDASFASGWGGMSFQVDRERRAIFPRGMGGLGWGLPAAIGAQVARPNSPVVVLAGDGAMTYCLGELATLAQEGLPLKVVVLNNQVMGWIKWEQAVFWEGRFISTDLSPVDFAAAARSLGCQGMTVHEPADVRDALAQALATPGPLVLDVHTSAAEAAVPKFTESEAARQRMQPSAPGSMSEARGD